MHTGPTTSPENSYQLQYSIGGIGKKPTSKPSSKITHLTLTPAIDASVLRQIASAYVIVVDWAESLLVVRRTSHQGVGVGVGVGVGASSFPVPPVPPVPPVLPVPPVPPIVVYSDVEWEADKALSKAFARLVYRLPGRGMPVCSDDSDVMRSGSGVDGGGSGSGSGTGVGVRIKEWPQPVTGYTSPPSPPSPSSPFQGIKGKGIEFNRGVERAILSAPMPGVVAELGTQAGAIGVGVEAGAIGSSPRANRQLWSDWNKKLNDEISVLNKAAMNPITAKDIDKAKAQANDMAASKATVASSLSSHLPPIPLILPIPPIPLMELNFTIDDLIDTGHRHFSALHWLYPNTFPFQGMGFASSSLRGIEGIGGIGGRYRGYIGYRGYNVGIIMWV